MKRTELIKEVSEVFETTQVEAKSMLEKFEEIIMNGLLETGEIPFIGGKFKISETKERECLKNPKQPELGKKMIPASHKVSFKAGKDLKEKVQSL